MSLTDTAVRNAKPMDKPFKIADSRGLYVLVSKAGKYFRWDYRFAGKRKTLAPGVYPDISLKDAREKHEDMRRLLARDIDPMEFKKQKKLEVHAEVKNAFETVAREWFIKNKSVWTEKHAETIISRLQNNVFPWLGKCDKPGYCSRPYGLSVNSFASQTGSGPACSVSILFSSCPILSIWILNHSSKSLLKLITRPRFLARA
jgi:hypothetical protein